MDRYTRTLAILITSRSWTIGQAPAGRESHISFMGHTVTTALPMGHAWHQLCLADQLDGCMLCSAGSEGALADALPYAPAALARARTSFHCSIWLRSEKLGKSRLSIGKLVLGEIPLNSSQVSMASRW